MHRLIDAMRVKDGSVFDLTHYTFYERDFVFFIRLAKEIGKLLRCDDEKAEQLGVLSQLLYLSSVLHVSLTEQTEDMAQLRAEKQMPVLLGDLLYGRFISALTDTGNSVHLPEYLSYLKKFNANSVDYLEGRMAFDMNHAAALLTEKTANVFSGCMGVTPDEVRVDAEQFFADEWNVSRGEKVTSMAELEDLFARFA